jgi:hypothetical protein
MNLNEAISLLNESGYRVEQINEIFGLSLEEKIEKLKKKITEMLPRFKITPAGNITIRERNGVLEISVKVASYRDEEFGGYVTVLYYPKRKKVMPKDPNSVHKTMQSLEIKNNPETTICSLIQHMTQLAVAKQRAEREEREYQSKKAFQSHMDSVRQRLGELDRRAAAQSEMDKYSRVWHQTFDYMRNN